MNVVSSLFFLNLYKALFSSRLDKQDDYGEKMRGMSDGQIHAFIYNNDFIRFSNKRWRQTREDKRQQQESKSASNARR